MYVYSAKAVRYIVKEQRMKHVSSYMFRQCERGGESALDEYKYNPRTHSANVRRVIFKHA